jgi:hypothetical protein
MNAFVRVMCKLLLAGLLCCGTVWKRARKYERDYGKLYTVAWMLLCLFLWQQFPAVSAFFSVIGHPRFLLHSLSEEQT